LDAVAAPVGTVCAAPVGTNVDSRRSSHAAAPRLTRTGSVSDRSGVSPAAKNPKGKTGSGSDNGPDDVGEVSKPRPDVTRKGVEMIHAKLYDLLRKQGVKPIDALGADFDPHLHQAVVHEESPEHREGEVIGELRKGYTLNDRLLRPAMVKVAKA